MPDFTPAICPGTPALTTNNIETSGYVASGSSALNIRYVCYCHLQRRRISVDRQGRMIILPGMQHSPGFLMLVSEARPRVKEITVDDARERLARNPKAVLLDVREDSEWLAGHAAQDR